MSSIPNRFNERKFRFYAPAIARAMHAFPSVIEESHAPYCIERYAQDFRDSITAKQRYGWSHPAVDEAAFNRIANQLKLSIATGHVLIGGAANVRAAVSSKKVELTSQPAAGKNEVLFTGLGVELESLCQMLSNRLMTPAPVFVVDNVETVHKVTLQHLYDVNFVPDESVPNRYRLI